MNLNQIKQKINIIEKLEEQIKNFSNFYKKKENEYSLSLEWYKSGYTKHSYNISISDKERIRISKIILETAKRELEEHKKELKNMLEQSL